MIIKANSDVLERMIKIMVVMSEGQNGCAVAKTRVSVLSKYLE
jgi:hypothetical protein